MARVVPRAERGHLRVYYVGDDGLLGDQSALSTGVTDAYMLPEIKVRASALIGAIPAKRRNVAERILRSDRTRSRWGGAKALRAVVILSCPPRPSAAKPGWKKAAPLSYEASFAVYSERMGGIYVSDARASTLRQAEEKVQARIADIATGRASGAVRSPSSEPEAESSQRAGADDDSAS